MLRPILPRAAATCLLIAAPCAAQAFAAPAAPPVAAARAPKDAFTDGTAKAREAQLAGLIEFSEWAHDNKAYRLRDIAFGGIIVLDHEHKKARKYLKYSFDRKKGVWVQKRYKKPRPGRPAVVEEGTAKLAELDDTFVTTMIDLIDEHEDALGVAKRFKELQFVLEAASQQADIRELMGYVLVEEDDESVWKRSTSVATAEARAEIAQWLVEAREAVPELEMGELEDFEEDIDVKWNDTLETETVRVVHNVKDDEATAVAEVGHLMWAFLPDVLGDSTKVRDGFTIYLVEGEKNRSEMITSHPLLVAKEAAFFEGVGATWFGGGPASFNWSPKRENRVDSSCKQITGNYVWRSYSVDSKRGWAVEGVGQYINKMVVGTRLTYSITQTEYEDKVDPRTDEQLRDANSDWIEIAAEVLAEAKPTRLARTLGRNSNELNSEDLVLAYSLVAYLREGHGVEVFEEVMEGVGKGEASSVVVLEEVLGAPLPEIQKMLAEWIADVGGHGY